MKNYHKHTFGLSFTDMLFNVLLAVFSIFILSVILINDPTQNKKIDLKAELMITMTWPDNSAHDIDLWLLLPDGSKVGFPSKQSSYVGLERDDLGITSDGVWVDGNFIVLPLNQENITFRAKVPGRYVVNVYFYARKFSLGTTSIKDDDIPVKIIGTVLNPSASIFASTELVLTFPTEERTAFSFDITKDGTVTNVQTIEVFFVDDNPELINLP
jgi:hypothetical protein